MSGQRQKIVYTAQSKQFFYCRDAVCEFVLTQGAVPLNPFKVFDYFLGDRVPRDFIRVANQRLLMASDELWVFGEVLSDGVLVEVAQASRMQIPIQWYNIDSEAAKICPTSPTRLGFEEEVRSGSGLHETDLLRHLQAGQAHRVVQALGRHEEVTLRF